MIAPLPVKPIPTDYDPELYWRTKKGDLLPISKMTTLHLVNCALLIERKHREWVDEALSCFPCFQGEMAQLYAEWEWQSIVNSKPEDAHPSYSSILEEIKSRGVNLSFFHED